MAKRINKNKVNTPNIGKLIQNAAETVTRVASTSNPSSKSQQQVDFLVNQAVNKVTQAARGTAQAVKDQKITVPKSNAALNARAYTFANNKEDKEFKNLFKNSYLHNVPSPLGGTVGDHLEAKEEINYTLLTGHNSQKHGEKMEELGRVLASKFSSDDAYKTWAEQNVMQVRKYNPETKQMEYVNQLKPNAKLPANLTKDEERLWQYYLKYSQELELRDIAEKEKIYHTANYYDYDKKTTNSYFDIVRNFIGDATDGNLGQAFTGLFSDIGEYHKRYIFNPLVKGDFKAFGTNILTNLGETMDYAGVGVRAVIGSNTTVYGTGTKLVERQDTWVYSGGKAKQKKLIELGAYELITKGSQKQNRRRGGYDPEKIERDIKAAGMWEEYLKFKEEYDRPSLGGGTPLEVLKETYTGHENYNMETGNKAADLALEVALDPTLVVGGVAKGISKGGIRAITRKGVKQGLEAALKNPEDLQKIIDASEETAKTYFRGVNESIYSAKTNNAAIKKNIEVLGEFYEKQGILDSGQKSIFVNQTMNRIQQEMNTKQFLLIQGAKMLDKSFDKADSIALKSVLLAPYLGYKAAKKGGITFTQHAIRNAVKNITDGLADETGKASIADLEDFRSRLDVEYLSDTEYAGEVFDKSFKMFVDGAERDSRILADLRVKFLSEENPMAMKLELDDTVMSFTKGRFSTAEELIEHLNGIKLESLGKNTMIVNVCQKYILELHQVKNLIEGKAKVRIRDYYKKLSNIKTGDDLTQLLSEAAVDKEILSEDFFLRLEQLAKNFDKDTLDQIVCDYELKHSTSVKEGSSQVGDFTDISTPWDSEDLLMKGEVTDKIIGVFNDVPAYKLKGKDAPREYENMSKFINKILTKSNDVDLRDFIDLHQKLDRAYFFRATSGKLTKSEVAFKKSLDEIANSITLEELSTAVTRDMQLVQMHIDKLAVLDRYLAGTNLRNEVFNLLSPDNPVGELIKYITDNPSEWERIDQLTGIHNFSKTCMDLKNEIDSAKAIIELRDDLSTLTERERWAVLESLFGISKGSPDNYIHMGSVQRDAFIEKVNLWLNSNHGESVVSLDGFSKQASDFESSLYKNYADEIQDPALQERIREFLKGGHIDPIKDVQKQMFQLILKDPESVKHYNDMCKYKDVLFTDIETMGLNSQLHDITSIATKRWVEIPEGASLNEILDILEDTDTEKLFSAKYDAEYLRENVSDSLLEAMFKHDPTIPSSRAARLERYLEQYAVKEGEQVVSESNILNDFMIDIDVSYHNNSKHVPTLVTHNNNGFDMKFIESRCKENKVFPNEIDHLSTLISESENTLMRLKGLEDDVILSEDAIDTIISSVERCMGKIKYKNNMRLFDAGKIEKGLRTLDTELTVSADKWVNDPVFSRINPEGISEVHESFSNASADIMQEMKLFKNNVLANPYRLNLQNLDSGEWALYFSPEEIAVIKSAIADSDTALYEQYNELLRRRYFETHYDYTPAEIDNLMRTIRELNEGDIPPLGYRVLFDDINTSKYFTVADDTVLSEVELKGMQQFTEKVTHTVNKRLKANPLIGRYMEDYTALIQYVREYAAQLEAWDEFSYLKYVSDPTSVNEAYVTAQHIWDTFYMSVDKADIKAIKFDRLDEAEKLKVKYRSMFGDVFNMEDVISEEAFRLLSNEGENFHHLIYKDVTKDYITKFMTDIVEDNMHWQILMDGLQEGRVQFEDVISWTESKYNKLKDRAYLRNHTAYVNLLKYFKDKVDNVTMLSDGTTSFLEQAIKDMSDEMNFRRQAMTDQIMRYILEDEDNLIAHLLFHNQFLNIPLRGSALHEKQVQELISKLNKPISDKLNYIVHNDFLHISLCKKDIIERIPEDNTVLKLKGEEKLYPKPEYSRIKVDTALGDYKAFKEFPEFAKLYEELDEELFKLTDGASAGSVGALHTFSKQKEMYKLLPRTFIKNAMTEAHTCDSKLWHGASFDMTNLGDLEHCWKYGKANDIDPLMITKEILEEYRGRVQTERYMVTEWFEDSADWKLKNIFGPNLMPEEKLRAIQSMRGYSCVILQEARTKSGFAVREVNVTDLKTLALAEEHGAIFVPYDNYRTMLEALNDGELNNKFYKIWAKYNHLLKAGQIMFMGTWIRNYIDETIKSAGETGSLGETIRYQITAMSLINDYHKVIRYFENTRGLDYMSMNIIRREFKNIPDVNITFEQFEFLEGWFKNSVSGGQSSLVKALMQNAKGHRNTALKQGKTDSYVQRKNTIQQYDEVSSEMERFLDLPYEEIVSLCNSLARNDYVYHGISKERFLEGFKNLDALSPAEYAAWNKLADMMIQKRAKRLVRLSSLSTGMNTIDNFVAKALTPMSRVEEMIRLGDYLALEAQGYKQGEIFKKIVETHFDYDIKSSRDKIIELLIPFYNFEKSNLLYWAKQIDKNPRMLRYLEHFWGELSWEYGDMSSEERIKNYSLRNVLLSGNVPVGKTGLYIKTNPSVFTALGYVTGGPSSYLDKLSLPLQFLAKSSLSTLGADTRALFSEVDLEITPEKWLQLMPIAGPVYDKFDKAFDIFDDEATYLKLEEYAQHGWQGALVRLFPSVFGATDRWAPYEDLEKMSPEEWEYYCRMVKLKTGRVWDANQKKFVDPDDYIPGMLNDPELSWSDTNYYNFLLHGTFYDSNQGKFITLNEPYISGGLNRNDLEWDELAALQYAINGKVWDYNKRKWVKVAEPQVVYAFTKREPVTMDGMFRGDGESILSKLGIISPVFADAVLKSAAAKSDKPLKNAKGQYILTGDAEHDNKVFDLIMSEVQVSSSGSSYMRYHNGNAGGFKYKRTSMMPSVAFRNSRVNYGGIKSGGKVYGKPYSAGKNLAGLRMATSRYTSYDIYYNFEYSYSYKYRNTIKAVADYPQTKLGIDRYMRMRGESLLKDFQNRNNFDRGTTYSTSGLSVDQRLNKIKMHWWNR